MIRYNRINNITGWVIFLLALIVYTLTKEATASFWDCGEFISAAYRLQVVHPPGAPIFLMIERIFGLFASSPDKVPLMMNFFSALTTAFAILFAFWIITRLAKRMIAGNAEVNGWQTALIMGCGIIGAGACMFMDSLWFSAVESEVYAFATFFFAIILWAMIKWEETADKPESDRWILFIALMTGLSIGVHLLSLLVLPSIGLIYYFRNYKFSWKGFLYATLISVGILLFILYGILDKFIALAAVIDRMFVNGFGLPFGSGIIFYCLVITILTWWGIRNALRRNRRMLYVGLMSFVMLMVGLTSYAEVLIRAKADPPINMNGINDVNSFLAYLRREQYGSRDLIYGPYWTAQPISYTKGRDKYGVAPGDNKYSVLAHDYNPNYSIPEDLLNNPRYDQNQIRLLQERNKMTLFPRMGSTEDRHAPYYYQFVGVDKKDENTYVPSFGANINFFFSYQIGQMFWRYFMWNFSGRQNDTQGFFYDGYKDGNWLTGIPILDKTKNPQLDDQPPSMTSALSHNVFYMLPFILGLLGMVYQFRKDRNAFLVIFMLFLFMGVMNLINMNEPPTEPRERDYAFVGSFFAFSFWIGFGVAALFEIAWNFTYKLYQEYLLYVAAIMLLMFITGYTIYNFPAFFLDLLYTGLVITVLVAILVGVRRYLKKETAVIVAAVLVCLPVPILMGQQGWDDHNRSNRTFARDIARNYLESCPPNAILFTQGDNDTYPLWYAQEVEHIRTDVRIINLSLLGVDWYINQLRHATNNTQPVNLTLTADKVLGDKRNQIVTAPSGNKFKDRVFELSDFIKFVGTDDKKYMIYSDGLQDYFNYVPSQNIRITVDSSELVKNGIVPADMKDDMVTQMDFRLSHSTLLKNDLMVLDIVASNINTRPICFAISVTPDAHLGLQKYFMQTNMVYRLTPVETEDDHGQPDGYNKEMNTDIEYDLLVNHADEFTYGGVENGKKIFVDQASAAGSIYTAKYLNYMELAKNLGEDKAMLDSQAMQMMKDSTNKEFTEVGRQLQQESDEKKEKALKVLDLMTKEFPDASFPYDYNMINVAQLYQQFGDSSGAMGVVHILGDRTLQDLDYYYRMTQKSSFTSDMFSTDKYHAETCLKFAIDVAKKANDKDYAQQMQDKWDALKLKYGIATSAAPNLFPGGTP